jgi:hypothetical protein
LDDDISGGFNYCTFHPDTARANSGIFKNQLMISTGMHFRGNFGPSNQEPVPWAHCELAAHLFQHKTYQVKLNEQLKDIIKINTTMQLPKLSTKASQT